MSQVFGSRPFRVLFLCTHNSARSQIAEAVLRLRGGARFEVESAGSEPKPVVHSLALRIIEETGGDPSAHHPKGFDDVLDREWDLVITVCDDAAEACPVLPASTVSVHWGVADPSRVDGTAEEKMTAFRNAHAALAKRIEQLIQLDPDELASFGLRDRLTAIHRDADQAE